MEEPEYRIYVSSRGDEPVAKDVGGDKLNLYITVVRNAHPLDIIYVREVNETVVRVIQPEEEVNSGFHFTS